MTLRLLFDVDGVLANFTSAFLSTVNDAYGTSHSYYDVTEWAIERAIGLTPEQETDVNRKVMAHGYNLRLDPYPGAQDAIRSLSERHTIRYVTSPFRGPREAHCSWTADREHWLAEHFGAVPHHVIHTSDKPSVWGDVLIDDKPSNVRQWQEQHPTKLALLWSQPYNQEDRDGLMVCYGWDHLSELLSLLEAGDLCR